MNRCVPIAACVGLASAALAGPDIRLRYATFDPLIGTPGVPAALAAPPASRVFIVQFPATPGPAQRAALEARGIAIHRYLPDHAYVVRAPQGIDPGAIPGVRWAGPYHGAYKLEETLLVAALAPESAHPAPTRCGIELLDRGLQAQSRLDEALRALGSRVEFFDALGRRVEATLTAAQLAAAAGLDDVSFIDPWGPPGADMDIVRQLSGASHLESQIGATGQGVRGELFDISLDLSHPAFQNPPPLLHGANGTGSPCHGVADYGIIFANDPLQPALRGMLPDREQGIFASWETAGMVPNIQHLQEIVDPGLPYRGVFQCRTVGSAQISTYTTVSAAMDDGLFQVDLTVMQPMGNLNATLSRPEAWAKNIIAVGGITHHNTLTRADDSLSGACFGPAMDGRVKPDVAHVFDDIFTTTCGGIYATINGTSASTSIVAGHVGLVCQMWHEQVFAGFGGGPSVFDDRPKATTIRALMVNSAYQYDWTAGGPNGTITRNRQGWGMPDLQPLLDRAERTFVINETDVLLPQAMKTYFLTVAPGETALKATMVYLDPPGNPAVQAQHRVNDLTLMLTAPSGLPFWGNVGLNSAIWSQYGGAPDTKNVVENVFVQNPQPGTWTIVVSAPELVMDARLETPELDADYALVVSGVQTDEPCYPDCNASGTLTIADFICFQAKFVAGDPYADCNGAGGLTIADFICFQARFVAGCP